MLVGARSLMKPIKALGWYLSRLSMILGKFYLMVLILLKGSIYGSMP